MQSEQQVTLSVSERPSGLWVLLNHAVDNVPSSEDGSGNQDLHITAFSDTDADCERQVSKGQWGMRTAAATYVSTVVVLLTHQESSRKQRPARFLQAHL